jgi:membrane protein implicated in regulation of membrane protease activity
VKEFLAYTAARLALFIGVYVVVVGVYLLVTGSSTIPLIWPFLVAVVASSILSVYLLRGLRSRFGAVIERRASAASRRLERARSKEDLTDEDAPPVQDVAHDQDDADGPDDRPREPGERP